MKAVISIIVSLLLFSSCVSNEAQPIKINIDSCDFCKMSIADGKYGAEIITKKGRAYKFDDISCMVNYCKENTTTKIGAYYLNDFAQDNILIQAETAFFISGGDIQSPMNGGIIGFSKESEAKEFKTKLNAKSINWNAIISK